MVKPTLFQKVFGRPSQRYSTPTTSHIPSDIESGYRPTSKDPPKLDLRYPYDIDEPLFTPASSLLTSSLSSPSTTPPTSAASLALSLSDVISLPGHTSLNMPHRPNRKLTYTDDDWAKDVRWLVAPRTDDRKPKSKVARRRSASASAQLPVSYSTTSLPPRLPAASPHPPPTRQSKSKGIGKAKTSTARSVIGMTALLEVEEDMDTDGTLSYPHDISTSQKRVYPIPRSPIRSTDAYHRPFVSSPLRSGRLTRQRSFSSPASLLGGDQNRTLDPSIPDLPFSASRSTLRVSNTRSHSTASTSKSPYTSSALNALDALAAHVSMSDSHDALPSTGTRGYTGLVLPHAATSPSLALNHASKGVWKFGKTRHASISVSDSIGVGLGFGDKVDLSRARLAQTTMASVEIVRGIAASSGADRKFHRSRGSVFGIPWFSRDHPSTTDNGRACHANSDSPLGFTTYRKPPAYVGSGSVLVQVWGVGLDATDARLTGIHPPRVNSSFAGAPYGVKMPKAIEKDKGRSPPVGYIPGRSFVGRVLEVGWEVGADIAKRGDWVVGLLSVHKCGALAELIIADRHRVHRVPNPFMHLKHSFNPVSKAEIANEKRLDVSVQRDSPPPPVDEEHLTVNELALLPLSGVPAYRAVRTFHQITQSMGKSQLSYGNSHNELHPILPPRSDKHDFIAGGDQEESSTLIQRWDSKPRALILRAHDGAGALAVQMLVREGWTVWAHVPVPFTLPGTQSELPDELKDEEEERELDSQRNVLRRIEDRLRGWGVDEVLFVPVRSMPLSALFDVSSTTSEVVSSWSSPSVHFTRSSSSSPSISPSPFSRSTTSTPLSSPYSHGLSSGHLPSSPSSSSHLNAFTTPYSFTSLPLAPYDCEQDSIIALMSYLTRSRVRLDAILDTVGGREIWDAGRLLLSRPVRDPSRQDIDAQFTTLVGDTPDRVVSTAGDNFRAGVRALRLGGSKDEHPFEDSGYHEAVTNGNGKDRKARPRPVNYSWVNVVSDIDWEGSDVHDTLCSLIRMSSTDGVKPVVGPPDFASAVRRDKGKRRAVLAMDNIEEGLWGKVISFESTPDIFLPGGGLEYGGTVVSRVAV